MSAVVFRLRSSVRRRWASTIMVTLIVALVCAVVLALAAGAQRTSSAPERYAAQAGIGFDALVTQDNNGGAPRTEAIAALPGVASADSTTFVFGGLVNTVQDQALVFSGATRPLGMELVDGRETDPGNANEFVASRSFLDTNDAEIGDSFELVTFTAEQIRAEGFSASDPQGPRMTVTMVGVIDGPSQLDDPSNIAIISPALLADPEVAVALTLIAVDLEDGFDLGTLRAEIDTLPDASVFSVEPGVLLSSEVRRAVQVQAQGLWLLAAAAALASIVALGQLVARQVRPAQSERERLAAIGFTDRQLLAESVGYALVSIVSGALIGVGLAIIPSGVFPSGFVRIIEPHPGILAQWNVLLGGAALFVGTLTLWTFAALTLAKNRTSSTLASPMVEAVATRSGSAARATGLRFALTRGDRSRGSVSGAIAGVLLLVAGVVGAITFGVSLDRLVTEPFRYGSNYDVAMGDDGADTLPDGLVDLLDAHPDVKSLILFAGTNARVGDATIAVLGMQVVRGEGTPYVVDGRLPIAEDEIALGQVTANELGAHVGGELTVAGPTQTSVLHVTGLIVMPGFGANDGLGDGGLVTMDSLLRIDESAQPQQAAAQLRVGVVDFFKSVPEFADLEPFTPFVPGAILNVERIRAIPFVLAGVLAALALLSVAHVLLLSIRSRRRDRAILSALGADRGWIMRSIHWQATVFTLLPVAIGIPVGIVVGRLIFSEFAARMGAVNDAALPLAICAVGSAVVIVVANAIAALPARRASRAESARLLRTE